MATVTPANALELRVYDLLRPFRKEAHEVAGTDSEPDAHSIALKLERKMIVLSQNIAFLAHNHVHNTERDIGAEDVFVVMRGWTGDGVGKNGGAIAVLVRYPEGTMGVIKAVFEEGANVMDMLSMKVDELLSEAF